MPPPANTQNMPRDAETPTPTGSQDNPPTRLVTARNSPMPMCRKIMCHTYSPARNSRLGNPCRVVSVMRRLKRAELNHSAEADGPSRVDPRRAASLRGRGLPPAIVARKCPPRRHGRAPPRWRVREAYIMYDVGQGSRAGPQARVRHGSVPYRERLSRWCACTRVDGERAHPTRQLTRCRRYARDAVATHAGDVGTMCGTEGAAPGQSLEEQVTVVCTPHTDSCTLVRCKSRLRGMRVQHGRRPRYAGHGSATQQFGPRGKVREECHVPCDGDHGKALARARAIAVARALL